MVDDVDLVAMMAKLGPVGGAALISFLIMRKDIAKLFVASDEQLSESLLKQIASDSRTHNERLIAEMRTINGAVNSMSEKITSMQASHANMAVYLAEMKGSLR